MRYRLPALWKSWLSALVSGVFLLTCRPGWPEPGRVALCLVDGKSATCVHEGVDHNENNILGRLSPNAQEHVTVTVLRRKGQRASTQDQTPIERNRFCGAVSAVAHSVDDSHTQTVRHTQLHTRLGGIVVLRAPYKLRVVVMFYMSAGDGSIKTQGCKLATAGSKLSSAGFT